MSNVLVTGGAGFIGSNLAAELLKQGHTVRILDNLSSGNRSNIPPESDRLNFVEGDVRDLKTVRDCVKGMDHVFHTAALVSVPESIRNPLEANEVNVAGTLNMLSASADMGVKRLILSSSCAVYGNRGHPPIREDNELGPESPYALTKKMCEEYCRMFQKTQGLDAVILRYFNVYGPRQGLDSAYAAAIPKFITAMLRGGQPVIYGDGEQTRDFVFVDDVVQANMLSMEAGPGTYNIGSGSAVTVNTLVQTIARSIGAEAKPEHTGERAGDIKHSLSDISRARQHLGYAPKHSFEDGIRKTVDWFSKNLE
jgi:nucleoside-diphosphate-sugar epimerase